MNKLVAFSLAIVFSLLCTITEAVGVKPEEPQLDEAYLLGIYAGTNGGFIVRENQGKLEILVRHEYEDKDFSKSYVYPLNKEHYDAYTVEDAKDNAPSFASEIAFERDSEGNGISARLDRGVYTRRFYNGDKDKHKPFRFKLDKPWTTIEKEAALGKTMPKQSSNNQAELVNITGIIPNIHLDLRYASSNNVFGNPLVKVKKAYLDKKAVEALAIVNKKLNAYGYSLLVWEAYRPWSAFKLATVALPKNAKHMLPAAEKGYSHNTGRSIDVSLFDLKENKAVEMMCDFDVPAPAQYPKYTGDSSLKRWERDLLIEEMEKEGFVVGKDEWWHFDFRPEEKYQMLDIPLENLS